MRPAGIALAVAATLVVVASAAVAVAVAAPRSPSGGTTHVVEIRGFGFSPAELEVAPGDTVVWVNRDMVPHTATDTAGVWDSGLLEANGRWAWVASEAGGFGYLCAYHPVMRGAVTVKGVD